MNRSLLLVVEDDPEMRSVVSFTLRNYGYDVREAATGAEALSQIQTRTPDAMVLDLGLPISTASWSRHASGKNTSSRSSCYRPAAKSNTRCARSIAAPTTTWTKPFREGELMARIRAALRRPVPALERRDLNVGDLRIDSTQRRVSCAARK
ncbi:MAG: response regulator [Pseudomonadota bacterium]